MIYTISELLFSANLIAARSTEDIDNKLVKGSVAFPTSIMFVSIAIFSLVETVALTAAAIFASLAFLFLFTGVYPFGGARTVYSLFKNHVFPYFKNAIETNLLNVLPASLGSSVTEYIPLLPSRQREWALSRIGHVADKIK